MNYISASEFAQRHGISERTARNYCNLGKIEGAYLVVNGYYLPERMYIILFPGGKNLENVVPYDEFVGFVQYFVAHLGKDAT